MVLKAEKPVQCTLVGDAMTGKSTLVQAFTKQREPLQTAYVATVLDIYEGCLDMNGQTHNLSILDNAGQHDYENMRSCSYKESEVLVLCYSVVERDTLESIKDFWVPEMHQCTRKRKPIVLVATQTDLRNGSSKNIISTQEGEELAKEICADAFVECTANDNDSVNNVFELLTTTGLKHRKKRNSILKRMFGR